MKLKPPRWRRRKARADDAEMENLKKWMDYLLPLVKYNHCLSDNPTSEEVAYAERMSLGCTAQLEKPESES